jgi:hypothetical protein
MKILDWRGNRQAEREREAKQLDEMRRADEPDQPMPSESYLSQTRD